MTPLEITNWELVGVKIIAKRLIAKYLIQEKLEERRGKCRIVEPRVWEKVKLVLFHSNLWITVQETIYNGLTEQ